MQLSSSTGRNGGRRWMDVITERLVDGCLPEDALLVSACLVGIRCRYDGRASTRGVAGDVLAARKVLVACPEEIGGLPTPRVPAQIVSGTGADVLDGRARVVAGDGCDVTREIMGGARAVLAMARAMKVRYAVLREGSPSCGVCMLSRGGRRVRGEGVMSAMLRREGVTVRGVG